MSPHPSGRVNTSVGWLASGRYHGSPIQQYYGMRQIQFITAIRFSSLRRRNRGSGDVFSAKTGIRNVLHANLVFRILAFHLFSLPPRSKMDASWKIGSKICLLQSLAEYNDDLKQLFEKSKTLRLRGILISLIFSRWIWPKLNSMDE